MMALQLNHHASSDITCINFWLYHPPVVWAVIILLRWSQCGSR